MWRVPIKTAYRLKSKAEKFDINDRFLVRLKSRLHTFTGNINGDYKREYLPTTIESLLTLLPVLGISTVYISGN